MKLTAATRLALSLAGLLGSANRYIKHWPQPKT